MAQRSRLGRRKRKKQKQNLLIKGLLGCCVLALTINVLFSTGADATTTSIDLTDNPQANIEYTDWEATPAMSTESRESDREFRDSNEEFSGIYYYEAEKESRYMDYHKLHPELSMEDVVWMVNTGLDKPFYQNIREIQDSNGLPLLVNKYNKLPDDYAPGNLVSLPSGRLVTAETKAAFDQMQEDAAKQGYYIQDVSTYRSIERQKELYNGYLAKDPIDVVDTYSARPGHSEHHTGRAIDLCGPDGSMSDFGLTKESTWINENAYKYGFIVRYQQETTDITGYQYEPWHITYVGTEAAGIMHKEEIKTLEEYVVKYIDHQPNY